VPPTDDQVAKETQKELISEYNRQDLQKKMTDGKIMAAEYKKDSEFQVSKGKKGKKAKTQ